MHPDGISVATLPPVNEIGVIQGKRTGTVQGCQFLITERTPIEVGKKALSGNPDYLGAYLTLTASYSTLNRAEEARKAVEEILRINPGFSLEHDSSTLPYKNQEKLDRYISALRNAGLPE